MARNLKGRSVVPGEKTYETAVMLARLRLRGLSTREIMAETGFAKSTVNNRLRVFTKLSKDLLRELAEGRLTTMEAERLAKFSSHATQWNEYELGGAERPRIRLVEIRRLLEACSRSSRSEQWKKGAIDALNCVLNPEAEIEGVWPSPE